MSRELDGLDEKIADMVYPDWRDDFGKADWSGLPSYSTDIGAAREVLEYIKKLGLEWPFSTWLLGLMMENPEWAEKSLALEIEVHLLPGTTPFNIVNVSPELICKAALKAIEWKETNGGKL